MPSPEGKVARRQAGRKRNGDIFQLRMHQYKEACMKNTIACQIESIPSPSDEAWILSIPYSEISNAVILFSALYFCTVPKIAFQDPHRNEYISISNFKQFFELHLNDSVFPVTAVWLETVLAMLLTVSLNGWSDTAHCDTEFSSPLKQIDLCISILPPSLP